MTGIRRRAAAGLRPGDSFTVTRTFTREEVDRFADLSRDYNPVHFDDRFARSRGFDGPVCHGLLVGSLLTEVGGQIGWLASGMSFRFRRPVYPGEAVTCDFTIAAVDERGRAHARVVARDGQGETVLEADLYGRLPGGPEREILAAMLAEGDPTNGLTREGD